MDIQSPLAMLLHTCIFIIYLFTTSFINANMEEIHQAHAVKLQELFDARANMELDEAGLLATSGVDVFSGNSDDNLDILMIEGNYMIVGSRNRAYNISLETMNQQMIIDWDADETGIKQCKYDGYGNEEICANYIRVWGRNAEKEFEVCGTNAFKPTCRIYTIDENGIYKYRNENDGLGKVQVHPSFKSAYAFADGYLYSAVAQDKTGRIQFFYRSKPGPITTDLSDNKIFAQAEFTRMFEYGDMVYLFFDEMAMELENCKYIGISIIRVPRVARVCKNDKGFNSIWTSFFKARMNCSLPNPAGHSHMFFDDIVAVSDFGYGQGQTEPIFYAAFNTPMFNLWGAAICSFKLSDLQTVFEGPLRDHRNGWKILEPETYNPAGKCVNDSAEGKDVVARQSYSLLYNVLEQSTNLPVLLQSDYRFSAITVDFLVNGIYDVLFTGTNDGRVIKSFNVGSPNDVKQVLIEDIEVAPRESAVKSLRIVNGKLVITIDEAVKAIPLARCSVVKTCSDCVKLQDPYCSWVSGQCQINNSGIQNLTYGVDERCGDRISQQVWKLPRKCEYCSVEQPEVSTDSVPTTLSTIATSTSKNQSSTLAPGKTSTVSYPDPQSSEVRSTEKSSAIYSADSMAIAVILTLIIAFIIGSLVGFKAHNFIKGRKNFPYLSNRTKTYDKSNSYEQTTYSTTPEHKQCNVIYNNVKNNSKVANGNVETKLHTGNSKVKKVYL